MLSRLFALTATALTCLPAQAVDWPWQEKDSVRYEYCRGFTVATLDQDQLGDLSRVDLWLAWNDIIRNGPDMVEGEEYQAGFEQVSSLISSGDLEGIGEIAGGDCALGRN